MQHNGDLLYLQVSGTDRCALHLHLLHMLYQQLAFVISGARRFVV
jgi:hypothetical protein